MRARWIVAWAGAGCGRGAEAWMAPAGSEVVAAEPQREGDAAAGYDTLINGSYVSCGVPRVAYDAVAPEVTAVERLEGRDAAGQDLTYAMNAVRTPSGVDVVGTNCLLCHAAELDGELVIGLGASDGDFTVDAGALARAAGALVPADPPELRAEWERWSGRVTAVASVVTTDTVGVNPADTLAAALFAHRDQDTLAWSDQPLLPLPEPVVTDVPAWWLLKKKHAMFYGATGRGDQARIMMSASALCTDDVDAARAIDEGFPDVRAYLLSLEAPPYPYAVDRGLADEGRELFEETCSGCHGTYGADETYPNLLVPLDAVGTDPVFARATRETASQQVEWFNGSFYGEIARIEPTDGYLAPPLDGIWATAPYLHNASVPTLAAVLDPDLRPDRWVRAEGYDPDDVGVIFELADHAKDDEPDPALRARIYDTTRTGFDNGGHPFGVPLDPDERAAVLEYLKTL